MLNSSTSEDLVVPSTMNMMVASEPMSIPGGIKLKGPNFDVWSQFVTMFIVGRGKKGYLTGTTPQPDVGAATYDKWVMDDAIVKGWLINSMETDVMMLFIRLPTAKDVWDAVSRTFYEGADKSIIYDLSRKAMATKQAGRPVSTYFSDLKFIWQELDHRKPIPFTQTEVIKVRTTEIEEERVYLFLAGLEDIYDSIRGEILRTDPLPGTENVFATLRREEQRRNTMLNQRDISQVAMAAKKFVPSSFSQHSSSITVGGRCSHCGSDKHLVDSCFKKNGYPEWWHDHKERLKARSKGKVALCTLTPSSVLVADPIKTSHHSVVDSTLLQQSSNRGKTLIATNVIRDHGWILDSGATNHMTFDASILRDQCLPKCSSIANANGVSYLVTGVGRVDLTSSLSLEHTLLIPALSNNLLSAPQVTSQLNCLVLIYPNFCLLHNISSGEIIGRGTKRGGLYYVDDVCASRSLSAKGSRIEEDQIWLWHRRLGHVSFGYLAHLFPDLFSKCKPLDFQCETCILEKIHRVPYLPSSSQKFVPFSLVHSDVWGPAPIATTSGYRWFVIFVDDCTRMTWLYLLKNKSEVAERFLTFHNMIKTQFSATLQVFRSDNGGEFVNKYLQGYFKEHGILHETTCVDTPQQNGVAERKNRQILEITRASLIGANMKPHWWEEAITTAVYLLNRVPISVLNFQTPLDKLATYMDIPSHLTIPPRVFGCVAFVNLQKHLRTKLDPCALKCVFVGYHPFQKGYRCYHLTTRKFYVSMDVTFSEHEMFYAPSILHSHLPGESHSVEEVNWLKLFPDNMVVVEIDSTGTLEKLPEVAVVSGEIIPVESKSIQIMELGQNSDVIDAANEPSLSSSIVPMSNPPQTDISEVSRDSVINTNYISESIDSDRYQLPPRSNRGVPVERFSPEPIKKPKYPIAHYVSTHRLSESSKSFVNDISTMHIPTKVSEALLDVKWAAAMKEEMTALQKNKTWELV